MKTKTFTFILISGLILFSACKDDDSKNHNENQNSPDTAGIGYVETNEEPSSIYDAIISTLNSNDNIGIVTEVNHSENAQNAGLNLDYTRTIYFGNPALGTPIMQNNIKTGLDLPQRITIYTDEDGDTVVTYNSVDYIINRHDLGSISSTDMIDNALANIINSATGKEVVLNAVSMQQEDGIISVSSNNNFETTYTNILNTLNNLESVSVIAELDHQANAQSVDLELTPAKLIIFGNPALGTPLMSESKTMALDLPQKILVYENSNGDVNIIYNDPLYIAERHGINNNNDTLMMISQALQNITASGTLEDYKIITKSINN